MKKYIYSWNPHSEGARKLAGELGWKRLRHQGSRFRGHPGKLVLNWGASELPPEVAKCRIINHPGRVQKATNKMAFYLAMMDQPFCPWFRAEKRLAAEWMREKEGRVILCRTVLNGHSGQGIVVAETPEQLVDAPLYVEYVPKKWEYRVHVLGGKVSVQQKKRRNGLDDNEVDYRIRNHGNGFVYARDGVVPPQPVIDAAGLAVTVLGLHFGAVDIGWNVKHERATVYEVNTAPGLEGGTVLEYAEFMRGL